MDRFYFMSGFTSDLSIREIDNAIGKARSDLDPSNNLKNHKGKFVTGFELAETFS
jgi:hypothetical protein